MSYDDLLKGRYSEPRRAYFVTAALCEREKRYFADFHCARCVVEEMRALHDDEVVNSFAWVVMPDHVHWLFQLGEGSDLSSSNKTLQGAFGASGESLFASARRLVAKSILRSCTAPRRRYTGHCPVYCCQSASSWLGRTCWRLPVMGCNMAVGANLFAQSMLSVRINSHLQVTIELIND